MTALTARQQEFVDAVAHHWNVYGFAPTFRWLGDHLGVISTNSVNDVVQACIRKGALTTGPRNQGRTLRVAKPPKGRACLLCGHVA